MTSEGKHPDKETLDAFGQGRLSDADISRVSEPLDSCEQCSDYLSQAGQDTVLDHLAAIGDSSESFLLAEPQAVNSSKSFEDLQETFSSHSRYALIRPLGSGGMGAVFLASHSVMQRQVAIKVINDQFVSNPDAVKRFFQEVRNASLLSHKNIVTAHDADSADDIHFLVMEYVEGESLAEAVARKGRLPVVAAVNYG
ncbi:MAG: protein kinase, partial [Planctomycetota bacterium]